MSKTMEQMDYEREGEAMSKTMEQMDYEREVFRKAMNDGDPGYARDFVVACGWSEDYVASQLLDWFWGTS